MIESTEKNKDTKETVARWKSVLTTSSCGPMIIADEVVAMAGAWKTPIAFSSWLREQLGRGYSLKRFVEWARAVDHLGKEVKRTLDARAALWLAGVVPDEKVTWVMASLFKFKREQNGGNVLTIGQVTRIVNPMLGRTKKIVAMPCERCALLEGLLAKAGIEVPSDPA